MLDNASIDLQHIHIGRYDWGLKVPHRNIKGNRVMQKRIFKNNIAAILEIIILTSSNTLDSKLGYTVGIVKSSTQNYIKKYLRISSQNRNRYI